jgi:hypothetical protein
MVSGVGVQPSRRPKQAGPIEKQTSTLRSWKKANIEGMYSNYFMKRLSEASGS